MHQSVRGGCFPGRADPSRDRPGDDAGRCTVTGVSEVWGKSPANILMFGDFEWDSVRTNAQMRRMREWLGALEGAGLAIVEFGAGRAIPTVRMVCEEVARKYNGTLIRINTREAEVPAGHISLPLGALAGLLELDGRLTGACDARDS